MKTRKRPRRKIGSIAQEKARCLAEFKRHPKATHVWCCHHESLHEELKFKGAKSRIRYILLDKASWEQAIRFRNFRPVKDKALYEAARALKAKERALRNAQVKLDLARQAIDKAAKKFGLAWRSLTSEKFNKEWPDNTWNGRSIF